MRVAPSYFLPTAPLPFLQAIQEYFIKTGVISSNLKVHGPDHSSNSEFVHKNRRNRKELWRSLFLPPALTRTIASVSLWFCLCEPWKPPRTETIQHLWWPAPTLPIIPETPLLIHLNLPSYNRWPLSLCLLELWRRPWIHLCNYHPCNYPLNSWRQPPGDLSFSLLSSRANKPNSLNLLLEVMPTLTSPWLSWEPLAGSPVYNSYFQ